ncbi:MAG: HEAT repeat domain-containing protein [Polyangiaceae bacterium]
MDSLEAAVRDRAYTPAVRDLPAILELLARDDEDLVELAERALARQPDAALSSIQTRLADAKPPLRGRLSKVVGRIVASNPNGTGRPLLISLLSDADDKTRRNAIIAAGKLAGDDVESALLTRWPLESRADHRRSLAASLGKIGTDRSLALLKKELKKVPSDDASSSLRDAMAQSVLMLERSLSRSSPASESSSIDMLASPSQPIEAVLVCRDGLEVVLEEEIDEIAPHFEPRIDGPGLVSISLHDSLAKVFEARTLLSIAFPLKAKLGRHEDALADAIVAALTSPEANRIIDTFTRGPATFRLAWASGGHRRAVVWAVARKIAETKSKLRNDPTSSAWEAVVHIDQERGGILVDLSPKAVADTRFDYRSTDVPASSHPTVAAALARVAGRRENDIVWDPFVGSGLELIERARLGGVLRSYGTDISEDALRAARVNLDAAKVSAELALEDARTFAPSGVTLIVSNPPMGRRVERTGMIRDVLEQFLNHAARVLAPGGRMVWASPFPKPTAERAALLGLEVTRRIRFDMGGFDAEIQRIEMPSRAPAQGKRNPRGR